MKRQRLPEEASKSKNPLIELIRAAKVLFTVFKLINIESIQNEFGCASKAIVFFVFFAAYFRYSVQRGAVVQYAMATVSTRESADFRLFLTLIR